MNFFAQAVLALWCPAVLLFFAVLPPRRAVITAALAAWMLLPNGGFVLPGLPDHTKFTATCGGILLGAAAFDRRRLLAFRPRWFDAPWAVWAAGNVVTAVQNDLGVYEGFSSLATWLNLWGLPYLIGRLYLGDLAGLRELAVASVTATLLYVPLCLFEVVFGTTISLRVYSQLVRFDAPRYGLGYRPVVFFPLGLELAIWLCSVTLTAYWLWSTGACRRFLGVRSSAGVGLLFVTTLLTKSIGALQLLLIGLAALWVLRRSRTPWVLVALMALPVVYIGTRVPKVWSGQNLVRFNGEWFGQDRAGSLQTRLDAENLLIDRALERPVWGWGGNGRNLVSERGRMLVVIDGLWIILLGTFGSVGLGCWVAGTLTPVVLLIRRCHGRDWGDPALAPAVAQSVVAVAYMLDCLSNAMVNPVFYMALGGLSGLGGARPPRRRTAVEVLEWGHALRDAGDASGAEAAYREAVAGFGGAGADGAAGLAAGLEALADLLAGAGRTAEADATLSGALGLRRQFVALRPRDPAARAGLADALVCRARLAASHGRQADAEAAWGDALSLREGLAGDALNDTAWFLLSRPDRTPEGVCRAVGLAHAAAGAVPGCETYWNTLGTAYLYAGEWAAAAALRAAADLTGGGTGFDHFPLAVASARLGDGAAARECYRRGLAWMADHDPTHPDLLRLAAEAGALLDDSE